MPVTNFLTSNSMWSMNFQLYYCFSLLTFLSFMRHLRIVKNGWGARDSRVPLQSFLITAETKKKCWKSRRVWPKRLLTRECRLHIKGWMHYNTAATVVNEAKSHEVTLFHCALKLEIKRNFTAYVTDKERVQWRL